jgi:T5orf172 domain
MEVTGDLATAGKADDPARAGCVYVLKLGAAADLYKIGKAKDYEERLKAHRTMSVERLTLYAEIESEHYGDIETYLKHLLQGHRRIEGDGREIYQAERDVIDNAVAAARNWAAVVLPRMAEAAALTAQVSDGTVLTPDDAVMELYRERLRLKQAEWAAKHEGERIDAELKLIMRAASELEGVATWRSGVTPDFDEGRFRHDHEDLYESYKVMRPVRQFKIRW